MKGNLKDLLKEVVYNSNVNGSTNGNNSNSSNTGGSSGSSGVGGSGADNTFGIQRATVVRKLDKISYVVTIIGDTNEEILGKLVTKEGTNFLLIPSINSECLVYKSGADYFLSHFSKLDSMELMGDDDTFVKYTPLKEALDILSAIEDNWITTFNSWTPVPNDGGAALKALFTANSTTLNIDLTEFSQLIKDMENKNIKQ